MQMIKINRIFFKLWKGFKVGWNTPILPENVIKFQLHPIIRIFRVLGGISTLYLLSNKALYYPLYIIYITLLYFNY